jgi:hypothetical protein
VPENHDTLGLFELGKVRWDWTEHGARRGSGYVPRDLVFFCVIIDPEIGSVPSNVPAFDQMAQCLRDCLMVG